MKPQTTRTLVRAGRLPNKSEMAKKSFPKAELGTYIFAMYAIGKAKINRN